MKHLRHLRFALPLLIVGAPLTWLTHDNPLTPRTWAASVLLVAECMFIALFVSGAVVLTLCWAAGTFDRKKT